MQENIPIEEVFENLRCSANGLTTEAANERLAIFGHNKLEEKEVPALSRFLVFVPLFGSKEIAFGRCSYSLGKGQDHFFLK